MGGGGSHRGTHCASGKYHAILGGEVGEEVKTLPHFYDQALDRPEQGRGEQPGYPTLDEHWVPQTLAQRPANRVEVQPRLNPVNGHVQGCVCSMCPGWYVERAKMAAGYAPEPRAGAPARQPRPLTDQVIPVSILMVVFTLCAMVLLPVITPFVAIGAMSLALMTVSLVVVCAVGLSVLRVVRQTPREVDDAPRKRTIIGQLINRG